MSSTVSLPDWNSPWGAAIATTAAGGCGRVSFCLAVLADCYFQRRHRTVQRARPPRHSIVPPSIPLVKVNALIVASSSAFFSFSLMAPALLAAAMATQGRRRLAGWRPHPSLPSRVIFSYGCCAQHLFCDSLEAAAQGAIAELLEEALKVRDVFGTRYFLYTVSARSSWRVSYN
jgi:hypothetical protein